MEKLKKEIEKMKADIKLNKNMEKEISTTEEEILNCKVKIMKAMNFCAEYGGAELLDQVQIYCGMI